MPAASKSIVINVPPEQFIQVVTDYEKYPEFVPGVKSIKVLSRSGNSADVEYEIEVVKKIHYTIQLVQDGMNVRWSFIRGDLMKKNDGGWVLKPEGAGKTHATYTADVGFGLLPVPGSIVKMLTETQLPGLLEAFKKRAESLFPPA